MTTSNAGGAGAEHPPSFQVVNTVELVSTEDSKITAVSVYSRRAEITRTFKFDVKTGQNHVTVNGLPNVLDQDSLRVEGRGAATIHDVTISHIPAPEAPTTSAALSTLLSKRERTLKALERCKKSMASLNSYLATLHVQHIDTAQLGKVVKEYDAAAEELDDRMLELEGQLKGMDKEVEEEKAKLAGPKRNDKLNIRAVVGVFADVEGEVEIALIYAVHGATWNAGYDIRVDMHTNEEPVTLIYKAAITQDTGEDWADIPLTLETATPTFGVGVPTLDPWNLSLYRESQLESYSAASAAPMANVRRKVGRGQGQVVSHREMQVSSKGNVSATFEVPGLITIPSDGAAHNVTIAELKLAARMSWVCVPKKDTKTHLSAKIKNASQYTLLRGTGSVYVDGSFISRSDVPPVSPDESFDCPLGLDPSIRVTYLPRIKKLSQSGFYTKTATHVFTQHITVFNTKPTPAEGVRIVEQVPVSEDAQIHVTLVTPALSRDGVSVGDSKIISVSLYSGRAEITRLYRFPVKTGQNQVNITGLPNVLDRDSIRVEGRGAATIHDVTLSDIPEPPFALTSERLDELSFAKETAQKALQRAEKSLSSLEGYLSTLNAQHTDLATLDKVMEHYESKGAKLGKEIFDLEKKLKKLEDERREEQNKVIDKSRNRMLGVKAAIGVFAASQAEVAIALIYAVRSASWSARYDIRVDMQTKEKPVTLIYQAGITQYTGESWEDVSLTLETASPTFGVGIPVLSPWNLSVYQPGGYDSRAAASSETRSHQSFSAKSNSIPQGMAFRKRRIELEAEEEYENEDEDEDEDEDEEMGTMDHLSLAVTSKGGGSGIGATFQVPGSITVPSDGVPHNVTVAKLELEASMSWVTVPKVEAKTHLKAKIKNASEYPLLPGVASVYVDGSFISKTSVPLVSPQESFDCPLGLDPSIRITYHPRAQKASQSGFYSKTSTHLFSQRITISNTKSFTPIENLKVVDQLPVSESAQIGVKLLSPRLVLPSSTTTTSAITAMASSTGTSEKGGRPQPVQVSPGVVAQWEGADEPDVDLEGLGRDGKLNWVCAVPPQGKVELFLSWEVTAPSETQIVGLLTP
ncbi:hypothetical protein D9615_008847 [Tricholomella constricta]|uniref:Mucoidy inhibitor A n=1 Tax=Tricholomella constricta TaxID=117010 RepID=A0A8H5GZV3_9AGAR|nr:hypothetical protein D9615_008847 [Tricholomella constricta]